MPFKKGLFPIRRSYDYLNGGKLVFKDRVAIMSINYNESENPNPKLKEEEDKNGKDAEIHKGARDFVLWNLPQVQYKNPQIQILTFKNLTPTPFITCYMENGEKVFFDIDSQNNIQILERLIKTLGKSKQVLLEEAIASAKKDNPSNFGHKSKRFCICTEPGQLPCPSLVPVPKHWRGKYWNQKYEDQG